MYKDSDQRTKDYLSKFTKDKVIQNLVKTDKPLILDIGGNVGQSVHRLKEVWEKAVIHSIEPLPEAFRRLHMCQALFTGVTTHNIALGSRNGKQDFYVSKHQPMLSSLYKLNENSVDSIAINKPENAHKDFLKYKTIKVHVRTLDTFAKKNNITHLDIIKMDAQGSEPAGGAADGGEENPQREGLSGLRRFLAGAEKDAGGQLRPPRQGVLRPIHPPHAQHSDGRPHSRPGGQRGPRHEHERRGGRHGPAAQGRQVICDLRHRQGLGRSDRQARRDE